MGGDAWRLLKEENAFKNPWYLNKIDCQSSGGWTVTGGDTAVMNVPVGADVVCTFTNIKKGSIIVEKQTKPDGATSSSNSRVTPRAPSATMARSR